MTERLFVHLGIQKTGSKALQNALWKASGDTFIYPLVEGGGFGRNWHRWIFERLKELDSKPLDDALDQISKAPQGVLSCEGFYELADPALDLLAARCREAASETIAVVFLRRQDEFINSLANQSWKAHRVSFAQAEARIEELLQGPPALFFDKLLDRLSSRFDQVFPCIYDRGCSSIGQFASISGFSLSEAKSERLDPNPAADAVQIETLKEAKRLAGNDSRLIEIVEATRRAFGERQQQHWMANSNDVPFSILDSAKAKSIMQLYQESNEALHARWFSEREQLFPAAQLSRPAEDVEARADVVQQIRAQFAL